ncbi:terminase large subunit domain-containing protein [Pantanalinema sp. GBBB05]|uniref:terminase large subunit domain-containing protein n=1 Tax=Pantanalinema sp. GBBB05 TaxID=2604139 RepID=UPI001D59A9C8|nr:hypothetical protein [Pantanalinema sp. GBBB05]
MPPVAGLIQSKIEWERKQAQIREKATLSSDDPREQKRIKARSGLLNFTCHTYTGYQPNWHHRLGCKVADRVIRGEIKRAIICEPPRYGKTERYSRRLPAYLLGLNPDAQIIATAYSADLASRNNRDVQRIIDSPAYKEIFPETKLYGKNIRTVASGSYLRNSEIFEVVDALGSYRSAGVEGGITGMGFGRLFNERPIISGLGIVDDPFKNRKEAESKTIRDGVWDWYTSTFLTRCEGDAAIIIVATRWHKDDLIGRLLKLAKEDPLADQWEVFKFQAVRGEDPQPDDPREPGEPLWLAKHSLDKLMGIKASIGPYDWASLYQQEPTSDEGSIFDDVWIRRWRSLPTLEKVVISVYSNFREASAAESVTLQLWGRSGEKFYLIDQKRDRLTYLDVRDAILEWIDHWKQFDVNVSEVLIESKRNGKAVIESLAVSCPCTVTPTEFGGDTEQGRAQAVSSFLASESVFIPLEAPWGDGFITELGDFPGSETVDQVGALTQALIYLALRAKTGLIYEFFNRSVHCLRGQDELDFGLDLRLPLHISLDFNRHPATAVVGQVREKDLFIIREFYLLESNTFELSEAICGWVERSGHRDKIYVYGDASGNSRTANSQQSNWEIVWDAFRRYGLKNRSVKRYGSANPPVRDTTISCNALFKAERVWILLSGCPELVKDLEQVIWKGDAIDKSDLMRAQVSDGFRYLVHSLFPFRQIKLGGQRSQKPVTGLAG